MDYSSLVDFDLKNDKKKKNEKKDAVPVKKNALNREDTRKRSRSRSPVRGVEPMEEIDYNVPNRQYGDLFCTVCDSHMNSEQMWENHILGKRHLKNSRKSDTVEQKYEYSNEEPTIQKELDKISPIAGLDHICEILRINQDPIYQCFLCSASLTTSKLLIEHIMGLKHQMAFLKEHDKEQFGYVDSSSLSKSYLEPIVRDLMLKYEKDHGRGKMSVKKEKAKPGMAVGYKKSSNTDSKKQPPPKSARNSNFSKSSKCSPPSKNSRYSPPPKSSRYSPPPKSSRYSPPPKSSRYSPPPKSARYSPSMSSRYSPPRMREQSFDSEWQKVPNTRDERSRDRLYSERSYTEEERRIEEPSYYRRPAVTYDSRIEPSNTYSNPWPTVNEGQNSGDLRLLLEQKKSSGMTSVSARPSASTEITNVSEKLLSLINDMSPDLFLKLILFKLDKMDAEERFEIVLDKISEKAAKLAQNIRSIYQPDLTSKFQEVLVKNGLTENNMLATSSQSNLQFDQNLNNFIGHFKARKNTQREGVAEVTYPSQLKSPDDLGTSYQNASSTYDSASGWRQIQTTSLPFEGFSSTPSCIPGLTLTEEPQPQASSAMSQFAQTAKNIFGSINVPSTSTNPYQNEDYNRLNYRY